MWRGMFWIGCLAFGLGVGLLVFLRPVYAETPTPVPTRVVTDDQVNQVAKQLYCPVCENIPLDTCGTRACEEWRQLIRQKLEEGWTEQQILDYFVQRYGERVLATPRPKGTHVLVYVLPPILVVAGVAILYQALKQYRREAVSASSSEEIPPESAPQSQKAEEDPYRKRLEDELRREL